MKELKKCPFCGGEAKIEDEHYYMPSFCNPDGRDCTLLHYAKCKKCGATTKVYVQRELAIEKWNRRVNKYDNV